MPSSINVSFSPSIPQARGSGGNGETTKNKDVTFFFHLNRKSDIDIELNTVVVPKNKQGVHESKDYLCNLKISRVS